MIDYLIVVVSCFGEYDGLMITFGRSYGIYLMIIFDRSNVILIIVSDDSLEILPSFDHLV